MLQASIAVVNGLGIFNDDYYANVNNTYSEYEVSNLSTFSDQAEEPGILGYVADLAKLAWDGLWAVMRIIFGIVIIYPTIVSTFGLEDYPEAKSVLAMVQIGIYVVYYMGWMEYKSGKSFEGMP